MTVVASHVGTVLTAFDMVHRGQVVTHGKGQIVVDTAMREAIEASDADVDWGDDDPEPDVTTEGADAANDKPKPARRGRPRKQG